MTTLSNIQEMRKLVDSFVQGKISESEFYAKLRDLAYGDPRELEELIAELKRLVKEGTQ